MRAEVGGGQAWQSRGREQARSDPVAGGGLIGNPVPFPPQPVNAYAVEFLQDVRGVLGAVTTGDYRLFWLPVEDLWI